MEIQEAGEVYLYILFVLAYILTADHTSNLQTHIRKLLFNGASYI